ncbi:uncharacterized protein K489DRAFT_93112 [Dissoconium aciculare CBS 342.82]|uniref:Uncharacterized protein n=1 Tax=Dissoconium aciculare CBS 342.82 TaxID=1314786 RepID=A0A6J3LRZ8_9PEZI|nr:uncharacterized protein K489DRAFT_93112 [Dissoconium aciculare CBS 342.82]KAF1818398.1 hypothetical protein K489DRAFT_93112 [Dissoconium aciculare CBS 342.82]
MSAKAAREQDIIAGNRIRGRGLSIIAMAARRTSTLRPLDRLTGMLFILISIGDRRTSAAIDSSRTPRSYGLFPATRGFQ